MERQGPEAARAFSTAYGSWELDLATREVDWSSEMYEIYGVDPASFTPTESAVVDMIHPDDSRRLAGALERATNDGVALVGEYRIVRPDGTERTIEVRGARVAGPAGERLVGTVEDTTDRHSDGERLWVFANEDPLTGLFNRRRFFEELEREVSVAARRGTPGAVLMLDLDRFKDVNDSLGHPIGDRLLVRVGGLLRSRLRSTDTFARLGGDEFAVVLPSCSLAEAEQVARELLEIVRTGARVVLGGRDQGLATSIGVAPFGPGAERTAEQLLVEADLAMYRAKSRGGDGYAVFDEEMRAGLAHRVQLEGQMRDAIDREEFRLVYQPLVTLADKTIVGCEALIRWQHPRDGLVAPNHFIPLAEDTGLINPIGSWVIGEACRQTASWRRRSSNLGIAINVSPRQLVEQDVAGILARALEASKLPAQAVTLEITETSLLGDTTRIAPAIDDLKRLGARIAIDDFGSGASSLSFLSVLPIDVIKIDRLFIDGLPDSSDDRAIVAAVISLADEMELTVVAEGVERERQHWELRELGCRMGQGFLYARPADPADIDPNGFVREVNPGIGDPSMVREFMRQIGIPARLN